VCDEPGIGLPWGARRGVVQDRDHPFLDLIGDDPFPALGLLVGLVPRQADDPDQEVLGQAVPADEVLGDLLAGRREPELTAVRLHESLRQELLHGLADGALGHAHPLREADLDGRDALLGHLVDRLEVLGRSGGGRRGVRRRRCHGQSLQCGPVGTEGDDGTAAGTATDGSAQPERRPRLFLLDGHSLSYRAFFALPETLATSTGQITNAVYGFTSMLIKLLSEEQPERIAVAFDLGTPKARLERYAAYKAGRRETPDEFRQQLGLILEVVETLQIPLVSHPEQEADDLIATLAVRAVDEGYDVVIVTADRDFFQVVRPGISVLFNRRGISDIVTYDVAAVTERFGLPPEQYLDYVALKGDSSDNIPGVPGVGEKTASQLVQQYGSVEELLKHTDELKPRVKAGIEAAGDQLLLNKDIARLDTDIELDLDPADAVMGEWDEDAVRRLFTSLEFRTLLERLEDVRKGAAAAAFDTELDLSEASGSELAKLAGTGPVAMWIHTEGEGLDGVAASTGEGRAVYAAFPSAEADAVLASPKVRKWVHDAKEMEASATRSGKDVGGVEFDTLLAGYLLDPAETSYDLASLTAKYLGVDVLAGVEEEEGGQLFSTAWRPVAAQAAAVAMVAPVMEQRIERAGLRYLLEEVELPLASVLAGMQARGVALDVPYLEDLSASATSRMTALQIEIWNHAGREFNLNSPPSSGRSCTASSGCRPGRRRRRASSRPTPASSRSSGTSTRSSTPSCSGASSTS
jgi:DNA polymerase-1